MPITYANPSPSVGKAQLKESLRNLWSLRKRDLPPRTAAHSIPEADETHECRA